MKAFVQWSKDRPEPELELDLASDRRAWAKLARKPEPRGGERLDQGAGWVYGLSVQGRYFVGPDHYHVEYLRDGTKAVRVTTWRDDPEDYPVGTRSADVVTFFPLAPDDLLGGAINTRQEVVRYRDDRAHGARPFAAFQPPPPSETLHGIWLSDDHDQAHFALRKPQSWRDAIWCEHLDPEEIVDGQLRSQRDLGRYFVPPHTITYYCTDSTVTIPPVGANFKGLMATAPASAASLGPITYDKGASVDLDWVTPSGEPNSADWPSGLYHVQLDVTAVGNLVYLNIQFQFKRLSSDLNTLLDDGWGSSTWSSTSGTGLKLLSLNAAYNSPAGNAGDRFLASPTLQNLEAHKTQDITLNVRHSDAYADGPWTVAALEPRGAWQAAKLYNPALAQAILRSRGR